MKPQCLHSSLTCDCKQRQSFWCLQAEWSIWVYSLSKANTRKYWTVVDVPSLHKTKTFWNIPPKAICYTICSVAFCVSDVHFPLFQPQKSDLFITYLPVSIGGFWIHPRMLFFFSSKSGNTVLMIGYTCTIFGDIILLIVGWQLFSLQSKLAFHMLNVRPQIIFSTHNSNPVYFVW